MTFSFGACIIIMDSIITNKPRSDIIKCNEVDTFKHEYGNFNFTYINKMKVSPAEQNGVCKWY